MTKTPLAVLVIFCLLLLAPLIGQMFMLDPFTHLENRTLAKPPIFEWSFPSLQKFGNEFQAYYNDNFGFRNTLVRGNHLFRYGVLGISPSEQVVIGKDEWLFYTGGGEIDDFRGITKFDKEQLRRWTSSLRLKRDWLKSQGIRYLYVIAPNKSTIYPEYLPPQFGRLREESGMDDFMGYVKKHTDLQVVDLRQRLLEEKRKQLLYLRTDTHWNNYGAFVGYTEMIRPITEWFPVVTPLTLKDMKITIEKTGSGDLADMMGGREFLSDENYRFVPKEPFNAIRLDNPRSTRDPFTMKKSDKALPRALIFRDSFFIAMVPFAAESFSTSRFIWARWDSGTPMEDLIAQYKPDVVIEEIVERSIKKDADTFSAGIPPYFSSGAIRNAVISGRARELELKDVKALHQAVLHKAGKGILVEATGPDPQLLLPVLVGSGCNRIVHVSMSSSNETSMQIFYTTNEDKNYTESKSIRAPIHKGMNQLDIPLMGCDVTGNLRLDPAGTLGHYRLEKITLIPWVE